MKKWGIISILMIKYIYLFEVLTPRMFNKYSGKNTERDEQRSNGFSLSEDKQDFLNKGIDVIFEDIIEKQKSIFNDLKNLIEKKDQENRDLSSKIEILSHQLEESKKKRYTTNRPQNKDERYSNQLNHQSYKTEIRKENVEIYKTYEFVNERLFLFKKIANSDVYERFATTTTVDAVADSWSDILEIHYANNIFYNELKNPKVTFFRNMDNSCYIIFKFKDTIYDVFYGVNRRNIEIGENSFSVYEVSDIGSFTDNISRLIYEDASGLYFVPSAENSVEDIINTYQKEGEFKFQGSILKISTLDGSITLNDKQITKDNFFNNWIQEEHETENKISNDSRKIIIEKVIETKTVLSTKQPKANEILRNFYPPDGYYKDSYVAFQSYNSITTDWLNAYGKSNPKSMMHQQGKQWLNTFINKRLMVTEEMSSKKCEKLIQNGVFSEILKYHSYNQKVGNAILLQLNERRNNYYVNNELPISRLIMDNYNLFKDPTFVKSLKENFAEIENDYEKTMESDIWFPFMIVRNL